MDRRNVRRPSRWPTTSSRTWLPRWISSRRSSREKGDVDSEQARGRAAGYLTETASVLQAVVLSCLDDIVEAATRLTASFRNGGTLLICGDGGRAPPAQNPPTGVVTTLSP